MKHSVQILLAVLLFATINSQLSTVFAQGTAFTYQGRLNNNGAPANGSYDFSFALINSGTGGLLLAGPVTNTAVFVTNGLFTTTMDFGNVFNGSSNWLQIDVSAHGANSFQALTPRQQLTPTPYAIMAENVSGIISAAQLPDGLGGVNDGASGSFATVSGGNFNDADGSWATVGGGDGNAAEALFATVSGGHSDVAQQEGATVGGGEHNTANGIGATVGGGQHNSASGNFATANGGEDNIASGDYSFVAGQQAQALNDGAFVWADSQNAVFASTNNDSFNVRAQGGVRFVTSGAGMTVDGQQVLTGGSSIPASQLPDGLGGESNSVSGNSAVVSGGQNNTANGSDTAVGGGTGNTANVYDTTVSGGYHNTANDAFGTVGGGSQNTAGGFATVGGGQQNNASGLDSTVAGGYANTVSGQSATVGGGYLNQATGNYGMIPGGYDNIAGGQYSFAAGQQAQALNDGSFVWADSQDASFASTSSNQFLIRAQGGVGIGTNNTGGAALTIGGQTGLFPKAMVILPSSSGTSRRAEFDLGNWGLLQDVNGTGTKDFAIYDYGAGAQRFYIGANGSVGIGTISPTTALQVNGTVTATTFSGNGSGLTSLNAANLTGAVPSASLTSVPSANLTGTINNARLSGVALTSGGNAFTGNQTIMSGNVGIGTTSPTTALQVNGTVTATNFSGSGSGLTGLNGANVSGVALLAAGNTFTANQTVQGQLIAAGPSAGLSVENRANNSQAWEWYADASGLHAFSPSLTQPMTINSSGNVGIGTTTPTKALLEVEGNVANVDQGAFEYYNNTGTPGSSGGSPTGQNYSIWASDRIAASEFNAYSDARIKNIIGVSSGAKDLNTLMAIHVTDYTYKDTIAKGNRPVKKVIAQQVEQAYPQAVSKSTGDVPDIYKLATVKDGWIQLVTTLKVGEKVKLIGEKAQGIYPVLAVRAGAFRTDFQPDANKVFVFGRQVKDFRSVDYEAIAMLNVSATQELAKRLTAETSEVSALKQQLAEMKQLVTQLARDNQSAKLADKTTSQTRATASLRQPLVTASLEN